MTLDSDRPTLVGDCVRFELDAANERAAAWVRITAAALVGSGALWIALLGPGVLGWTLAGLGALAALGWLAAVRASRARADAGPAEWYLELDSRGLTLAEGPTRHQVPWEQVQHVEVDEDRLVVAVHRHGADPLVLEPRYRKMGVYDLADAVRRARSLRARRGEVRGGDDGLRM